MFIKDLLLAGFVSISIISFSQKIAFNDIIASFPNADELNQETIDELEFLYNSPICSKDITINNIDIFNFLSEFQKKSFLMYLSHHTLLHSKYELLYIEGFSEDIALLLSYFITTDCDESYAQEKIQYECKTGFTIDTSQNHFAIKDLYVRSRYYYEKEKLLLKLSFLKRTEERFLEGNDILAGGMLLESNNATTYLGSLKVAWGQGLTASSNSFGNSVLSNSIRKKQNEIGLNTSHVDLFSMHGVGFLYKKKKSHIATIISEVPIFHSKNDFDYISKSMYNSEIKASNRYQNTVYSYSVMNRFSLRFENAILGASSVLFYTPNDSVSNNFPQTYMYRQGVDWQVNTSYANMFGEACLHDKKVRFANGFDFFVHNTTTATVYARYLPAVQFYQLTAPMASASMKDGEKGVFVKIHYAPFSKLHFTCMHDNYMSSSGATADELIKVFALETNVALKNKTELYNRIRYYSNSNSTSTKFSVRHSIAENINFRSNCYLSVEKKGPIDRAFDATMKFDIKEGAFIKAQYIDLHSVDNRIYIYEQSLPADFYFVSKKGIVRKGILILGKKVKKHSFQLKCSFEKELGEKVQVGAKAYCKFLLR